MLLQGSTVEMEHKIGFRSIKSVIKIEMSKYSNLSSFWTYSNELF